MKNEKRVLSFDDFELRLLVGCINRARSAYIDEGLPVDDVNDLLVKTMEAPTKKEKHKADRAAR